MQAPFADPLLGLERHRAALPLVGRETELQMLRNLLDTVALDLPMGARALTISGEVGVGKTRLLAELSLEARERGFSLLQANAYEAGRMFPYLPFIEALRPLLRTSSTEQLRRYLGLAAPSTIEATAYSSADNPANGSGAIALSGTALLAALARIFPTLPALLQVEPAPPEILDPMQEKFRLLDAVATLLEHMADERPVMLCIDNLQWADSASLELLLYLTVRLHSSRVALVGATRPPQGAGAASDDAPTTTAANQAATRALTDLIRHGMLLLLPLGPLDANAAAEYVQALLPGTLPQNVARPLLDRAGGNPFFLEELVRALTLNQQLILQNGVWKMVSAYSTRLPESIVLAVAERLQGQSMACRALLQCAALFGRTFPIEALPPVLAKRAHEVHLLIDEAVQAGILTRLFVEDAAAQPISSYAEEDRHPPLPVSPWLDQDIINHSLQYYIFCQGIVQETLLTEVPAHQARVLHTEIGKALETCYAHEARHHAAELAHHYKAGGEQEATLYWSLLAGEDAARQQAHREAISHFRLVLKLLTTEPGIATPHGGARANSSVPDIAELHLTIGELWSKLGELDQAISAFQQALQQLQNSASPLLLARTNRLLADCYRIQACYDQALAHLQVAQSILATQTAPPRAGGSLAHLDGSNRVGEPLAGFGNAAEHILLLQAEATLNILLNHPQKAEAALWQSHRLATAIGDRNTQAFALHFSGWLLGWGEQIHQAVRLLEQAHEQYIAVGDPFRAAMGDQLLGIVYQSLGEMERASLYTLRGLERARRYGVQRIIGLLYWNQGMLALTQGEWQNAENHLQQALQEALINNDIRLKPLVLLAQAHLKFRRGDWPGAEKIFLDAIQAAMSTEWHIGAVALYGHFLAVTGRHSAARTQLERAAALPEPPGFNGHYYIPFLAEGYLHLAIPERASTYIERIRTQRGLMYYGNAVDRMLGVVAAQMGDWGMAEQAFEEGLALCQRAGNRPEEGAILYERARAALMQGNPLPRVHELCSQARAIFEDYGMERAVAMVDTLQEGAEQLQQHHEQPPAVSTATTDIINPQEITSDPRSLQPAPSSQARSLLATRFEQNLTKREQEVLRLVAEGHTDREVAEMLIISPRTANRHLSNIFIKLDVPGRAAAVAYAIRHGLV